MGVLERRWLILPILLVLALAACRPAEPDLELTAHEAPVESPLATQGPPAAPLEAAPPPTSPLATPVAAVRSPVQPPIAVTRAAGVQPTAPAVEEGAVRLIVMHTNDTWGYYDPCG
jgi:hypothetical protein